jgi:2-polyprenyl-3-methyl-5-hydroxy-6-metoxy-1,4-benzoquinol methylase
VFLHTGSWIETSTGVIYVVDDIVQFTDDFSHWKNGLCRLLNLSEDTARSLIELAVEMCYAANGCPLSTLEPANRLVPFKQAVSELFKLNHSDERNDPKKSWGKAFDDSAGNHLYARSIGKHLDRLVVGNDDIGFAWQISAADQCPVKASSVNYNKDYFDSPGKEHFGMKDYLRQDNWRLEKSARLLNTIIQSAKPQIDLDTGNKKFLDVGSATGYFRKAVDDAGFLHYGLDLSADAIKLCKELYGYETYQGGILDLPSLIAADRRKFDVITLWDVIEHIEAPLESMKLLADYLADRGIVVIRTPNLDAIERDILREKYYSFKLDHIWYFTPRSLSKLMDMAGFKPVYLETTSHIFKGIFGANHTYQIGKELNGADIIGIYSRKAQP